MKLIRLSLENFRQHVRTEVAFRDGMTAIVGANGSGKTTLLDAILFALYGAVPGTTLANLRTHGVESRQKAKVNLDFEFEGETYRVTMGETDAELSKLVAGEDVLLARGKDATKDRIRSLLRLTLDQFANSFCSRQKQIGFFPEKTDRQAEIARMLGYDQLKRAKKVAADDVKILKAEAAALETVVKGAEDPAAALTKAREEERQAEKDLQQRRNELGGIEASLPALRETASRARDFRKLAAEIEELKAKGRETGQEVKAAEKDIEAWSASVEEYEKLADDHRAYLDLERESKEIAERRKALSAFDAARGRRDELARQLARKREDLGALAQPDLDALQKELDQAAKDRQAADERAALALADWEKAKWSAAEEVARLESAKSAASRGLSEAKELVESGLCPTCRQPTDSSSFREKLAAYEREWREAEDRFSEAVARKTGFESAPPEVLVCVAAAEAAAKAAGEAQGALDEAKRQAKRIADEEAGARDIERQLERLQAELAGSPEPIDEARDKEVGERLAKLRPAYERRMSLAEAPDRLRSAKAALEEAKRAFEEAKAEHAKVVARQSETGIRSAEEAELAIESLTKSETAREQAALRVQDAENLLKKQKSLVGELEKKAAELEQNRKSLAAKKAETDLRKYTGDQLEALRVHLNGQIRPELARLTGENLALLTQGRYHAVDIDEAFEARVVDGGVAKPSISGGEEDVLALSLRLALSSLIQDRTGIRVSLLILDEVFGSLDADRRQALMSYLSELKVHYRQVLVISHIDEINEVADQCLHVVRQADTGHSVVSDVAPSHTAEMDLFLA